MIPADIEAQMRKCAALRAKVREAREADDISDAFYAAMDEHDRENSILYRMVHRLPYADLLVLAELYDVLRDTYYDSR